MTQNNNRYRIIIRQTGGYAKLKQEPYTLSGEIEDDEVIVKTAYAGVNYADCLVRLGLYQSAKDLQKYPIVPGFDFSGTISKVGSNVSTLSAGDTVFGITLFGAYQDQIKIHKDYVYKIPESLSLKDAASLPTTFLTAYYLLNDIAHIQHGERILVRSLAGGVGHWLGILGKECGAEVYGTSSTTQKRNYLLSQGYPYVYTTEEEIQSTFDVITNAYGGKTISSDLKRLNPRGRLILYGFHGIIHTNDFGEISPLSRIKLIWNYLRVPSINPFALVNQNKTISGFNLSYLFKETNLYKTAMSSLLNCIERNVILPPVQEMKISDIGKAHNLIEHGKTIGKIVLRF